jgi:hypothetical protein
MQFLFRRRFIVFSCFFIWIGAAGLICRTFLPGKVETDQPGNTDASQVVRADTVHPVVTLAQR